MTHIRVNTANWAKTDLEQVDIAFDLGNLDQASAAWLVQPHINSEFVIDHSPDAVQYGRDGGNVDFNLMTKQSEGFVNLDAKVRGLTGGNDGK